MTSTSSKAFLVTGVGGFIGGHLCTYILQSTPHSVHAMLRGTPPPKIKQLTEKYPGRIRLCVGDITKAQDVLAAVKGVAGIFHAAGKSRTTASMEEVLDANVIGTNNILNAAEMESTDTCRVKVVLFSTTCVYGETSEALQREDAKLNLETPYALSKAMCENMCDYYSRIRNVPTVRLRIFHVYGPDETTDTIVGNFRALAAEGKPLPISGDGSQTRDFVHVDDVVEMCWRSMSAADLHNTTLNVGTGVTTTIKELADIVRPEGDHKYGPSKPYSVTHSKACLKKCRELLGWAPQISLRQWLSDNSITKA